MRRAFKVFDRDGSGFIEKLELKKVLTEMGDKMKPGEVDAMFKMADTNNDNKIHYDGKHKAHLFLYSNTFYSTLQFRWKLLYLKLYLHFWYYR